METTARDRATASPDQALPLSGLLVMDLTHAAAGPLASMLLADFGATVIKVEKPGRGDHTRHMSMVGMRAELANDVVVGADYYLSLNRNKRSVAIDFKTPAGRALGLELARRADVLIANFRPGVSEKLGLDYEVLKRDNPGLVYCEITGFGRTGERGQDPGMDIIAQALAGSIAITGAKEGPPMRPGPALADLSTSLQATIGILMALLHRKTTGRGQRVDVNLVDSALMMLSNLAASILNWNIVVEPFAQGHPQLAPYQGYRTADGWMFIACGTNRLFRKLCESLGREDLIDDPRFRTNPQRVAHMRELEAVLSPIFAEGKADDWVGRLRAAGVPAAPVLQPRDGFAYQEANGSRIVGRVEHPTLGTLKLPGISIALSETPGSLRRYPPRLGEDTAETLATHLGLSAAEIEALAREGAIEVFDPRPAATPATAGSAS